MQDSVIEEQLMNSIWIWVWVADSSYLKTILKI